MNTEDIRVALKTVDQCKSALNDALAARAALAMARGQTCAALSIAGLRFDVTLMDSRTYMPKLAAGMEVVHRELLAMLDMQVSSARSRLEGAEFKVQQLAKGRGT